MKKDETFPTFQRKLKTLRPQYDADKHEVYVDALTDAIKEKGVQNIALSGPYGVGKSSILQGFKERHNDAIFISLSTLGADKNNNHASNNNGNEISAETNRIQKEIVKQILYRIPQNRLPASRFKRIQKFKWRRQLSLSTFIGLVSVIVIVAIGAFSRIPMVRTSAWQDFSIKFLVTWALSLISIFIISYFTQGKLHLDKLTAGPATLSLAQENDSYFDRYLDEIIYFFEISRCRIVVFEDIDRFNNPEIFEELRELNTILNNAEQLKMDDEIAFIYAMKDSIFERSSLMDIHRDHDSLRDKAVLENCRANRTKFFDIIIPVVPFVTHRSARDIIRQELDGSGYDVSDEMIDRVAKHVPDFRLLRSVCNEYKIYFDNLFREDTLKLKKNNLFAMMLYKAIHLQDFENIRLGKSNLDEIYQMSVQVIKSRINELNKEYKNLESELGSISDAIKRGNAFIEMIRRIRECVQRNSAADDIVVSLGGSDYSIEEIRGVDFWSALFDLTDEDKIFVKEKDNLYNGGYLTFNKQSIAKFIGDEYVSIPLKYRPKSIVLPKLDNIKTEIERYRQADMSTLMEDSFAKVPSNHGSDSVTFEKYVVDKLGSELAGVLIRHGYIDNTFIFYTSIYHDIATSANAMVFRLQHMEGGITDVKYPLEEVEVNQLISDPDISASDFARTGAYNIDILKYLLNNHDNTHDIFNSITEALLKDGDAERDFLKYFFSLDVPNVEKLIARLAPKYSAIFTVLDEAPYEYKVKYFDLALQSISCDVCYEVSSLRRIIEDSYENMDVFVNHVDRFDVEPVAEILKKADVKLANLKLVNEKKWRRILIEGCCYQINRCNLEFLSGGDGISLDILYEKQFEVYKYILRSLDDYVALIQEHDPVSALSGKADVSKVIADVTAIDIDLDVCDNMAQLSSVENDVKSPLTLRYLSDLLDFSNDRWEIDFADLPSESWKLLVEKKRVAITASNLQMYIGSFGLDKYLASALSDEICIESSGDLDLDGYNKLACAILKADDSLLSIKKRVSLVQSIGFDSFISVDDIMPIEGEFIGRLISGRLIADDADSFYLVKRLSWQSREFAICSSQAFTDFMTPELVDDDAPRILRSELISDHVKQHIVDHMDLYCCNIEYSELVSMVVYLKDHGLHFNAETIMWLANSGLCVELLVSLMVGELGKLEGPHVKGIVRKFGRPYSDLLVCGADLVYIDSYPDVEKLLLWLRDSNVGQVSSFYHDEKNARFKVYRKRVQK